MITVEQFNLCSTASNSGAASFGWVSIEGSTIVGGYTGLIQIGWAHVAWKSGPTCRFWGDTEGEPGSAFPTTYYNCGNDSVGAGIYFKVALDGTNSQTSYTGMYDCGTSGWSNCTLKQDSYFKTYVFWNSSLSVTASEVAQKESDIMGTSSLHGIYGLLQTQNASLNWDYRVWTRVTPDLCYFHNQLGPPDANGKNEKYETWTYKLDHTC